MKLQKIIVHGAFQNENFGDLLILKIFIDKILTVSPGSIVLGSNVGDQAVKETGIERASFFDIINPAIPVIFCGGGYFGERDKRVGVWAVNLIIRHLRIGLISRLVGRKYAVLATGFGPLSKAWYRSPTMFFLKKAALIRFRDVESLNYYSTYGGANAKLAADCVLSTTRSELYGFAGVSREANGTKTQKVLVIHIPGGLADKAERLKLAGYVSNIVKQEQFSGDLCIKLLSDNGLGKSPDFFSWFPGVKCEVYPYASLAEVVSILDSSDYIITTKLHVGICGAVLGKSVLSYAAHQKTKRFYTQIGRPELCVEMYKNGVTVDDCSRIERLLTGDVSRVMIPEDVLSSAKETWDSLGEFLS